MNKHDEKRNIALWDRLAGTIIGYVNTEICSGIRDKNERIVYRQFEPFGDILGSIKNGIYQLNMDTIDIILNANDINELSPEIQKIVLWHLPRFLKAWPEYKDEECLRIQE